MKSFPFNFSVLVALLMFVSDVGGHEQCKASPYEINTGSTAIFAVILSTRQSIGTGECGSISRAALHTMSTIQWAVNKINSAQYVPLVSMGKSLKMRTINTKRVHLEIGIRV